jgi:hypothetical protein
MKLARPYYKLRLPAISQSELQVRCDTTANPEHGKTGGPALSLELLLPKFAKRVNIGF